MHLSCQNISFRYPNAENSVFSNLTLEVTEPGFNALFGPSGVGKTSFARMIAGDIKDHTGEIRMTGIDRIAYTYNLERLPGWSAVGRHLEKNIPESRKERMAELIEIFGIRDCMDQRFSQLSLGQKNRVNLIRYLLQDFQLIILDESLANVDELTRERIILRIKEIFPRTFFMYISHNVVEVSKFCKEILVFRGAHKRPQTVMVRGQDLKTGQTLDKKAFELTMLEIMNAS
ncbi:nitrate ABC transporter ATP-binding protein [Desulfonema ishimotonii]|uniref:Nitrate ABC transporter ATP-binding protein n=2 Tax=Desulfonema ishimotonii TaxID=45657 RepID=A0A401FWE8_9BACT|nr:nitrate ABC transporter ATP-binding protein [Desulfonema ishimotonii]